MNHAAYRNKGRLLLTDEERRTSIPWYAGEQWLARKAIIASRVQRKQTVAHERTLARRAANHGTPSVITRTRQKLQSAPPAAH